jgi:Uma2 family endonuclease
MDLGRTLTFDEWAALHEDESGEWADGRLVEEEMADIVHEAIVAWLIRILGAHFAPQRGWVFGSEVKLAVSPRRGRKADVTVYLPGSRLPPRRGPVRVPPDIAVEVVSSSPADKRRDRIEKHDEYAAFGVRWYWIIDPDARTVEVFERIEGDRYVLASHGSSGSLRPLPGFHLSLDLDALWAELDELPAEEAD